MFARTAGKNAVPEDAATREVVDASKAVIPVLSEAIDGPLKQAHRTIDRAGGAVSVSSNGDTPLVLDSKTLDFLKTRLVDRDVTDFEGNVVAYNVLSGKGRVFLGRDGRSVPFEKDDAVLKFNTRPLSWSLDRRNRGLPGEVILKARKVTTLTGELKKLLVSGCKPR